MKFKKKLGIVSLANFILFGTILPNNLNEKNKDYIYPLRLEKRLQQEIKIKDEPQVYFVGIRADNEKRYVANFSLAYQILLEKRIFNNSYILTEDGEENYYHPVDDVASREAFSILMTHLSKKIRKEDKFIFYFNNHGLSESLNLSTDGEPKIKLSRFDLKKDKGINELELEIYFSNINAKERILIFDCCYSGGFAKRFGKEYTIAISSTKSPEEAGYSSLVNSFSGEFFRAFKKNSRADKNNDGLVSILEAFNFAKENHSFSKNGEQHPQLIYDKNKIDPSKIGLD